MRYAQRRFHVVLLGSQGRSQEFDEAINEYLKSPQDKASQRKLAEVVWDLQVNKWSYRVFLLPLMKLLMRFMPSSPGVDAQFAAVGTYDAADRLGLIKAPTLVIAGTDDRLIKPASSDVLAGLVHNVKLVKVEGGGHSFMIEMSGEFNREVLDFIRS